MIIKHDINLYSLKIYSHLNWAILLMSIAFVCFGSNNCFSQDTIVLREGKRIPVKVMEVKKNSINYKKVSNLNGPTYEMDIKEVGRVKYESGAVDEFNPIKGEMVTTESMLFGDIPRMSPSALGRNTIYLNVFELMVQNFSFSYERIIGPSGKVGLRVPISINFSGNVNSAINSYFYSGLDLNFYPFGQGQARFIIGPSLRFGSTKLETNMFQDGGFVYSTAPVSYSSFLIQGGFVWCPVKELSILTTCGFGSRYYFINSAANTQQARGAANFTFCVGYRF